MTDKPDEESSVYQENGLGDYPARFVEFFGPSLWKSIHSIAFTYPHSPTPEHRRQYIDFFRALGPVIPCPSCAIHYQQYLNQNPIDADNRQSLAKWVYDLHDSVNKRNNKEGPSFEEVRNDYNSWDQSKQARFNESARSVKLRRLGDPFFGRGPGGVKELNMGAFSGNDDFGLVTKYVVIIALVLILFYCIYRAKKKVDESETCDKEK